MDAAQVEFMHTFHQILEVNEGDTVLAAECRPIAKSVSFVVVEVKE